MASKNKNIFTAYECAIQLLASETELVFPSFSDVVELHNELVDLFGGLKGIRSPELLESALGVPSGAMYYGNVTDPGCLAAILGAAIVKNHAFLDGNKRTGMMVMSRFAEDNHFSLLLPPSEHVQLILQLSANKISHDDFVSAFDIGMGSQLNFSSR